MHLAKGAVRCFCCCRCHPHRTRRAGSTLHSAPYHLQGYGSNPDARHGSRVDQGALSRGMDVPEQEPSIYTPPRNWGFQGSFSSCQVPHSVHSSPRRVVISSSEASWRAGLADHWIVFTSLTWWGTRRGRCVVTPATDNLLATWEGLVEMKAESGFARPGKRGRRGRIRSWRNEGGTQVGPTLFLSPSPILPRRGLVAKVRRRNWGLPTGATSGCASSHRWTRRQMRGLMRRAR